MRKFLFVFLLLAGGLVTYWLLNDARRSVPETDQRPVTDQQDTVAIELYFGSSENDPQSLYCDVVYPVKRQIPRTSQPARVSLQLLLEGPSPEERSEGYFTSINPGVEIRDLSIERGTARVDFSRALDEGVAGSCRVSAIRAQIEATLRQFESVREVQITVEGQAETVLQP